MTRVLHGIGLINLTKREISQIQTIENYVYKQILKARNHAATAAVRGDIGSSLI